MTVTPIVASYLRKNNAVVVVHGIDYNKNGVYDGVLERSDIDRSLTGESTAPALCGPVVADKATAPQEPDRFVRRHAAATKVFTVALARPRRGSGAAAGLHAAPTVQPDVTGSPRAKLSGPRLAVPATIAVAIVGFVILSAVAGSPSKERRGGATAPAVKLRNGKLGRILVDAQGRTLYLFLEDVDGKSSCYGPCTRIWPPALVTGTSAEGRPGRHRPQADHRRAATRRAGASSSTTAIPLYTTDADAKPGDTNGQAVFNTWFAVSRGGQAGRKGQSRCGRLLTCAVRACARAAARA